MKKDEKPTLNLKENPFLVFHFVVFGIFLVIAVIGIINRSFRTDWMLAAVSIILFLDLFIILRLQQKKFETQKRLYEKRDKFKNLLLLNMSRDVRTPMNGIIGFTDLAMREGDDVERIKEHITRIRTSGQHLLSIIDDVVEFSRIESGNIQVHGEPVNLTEVMNHLMDITYTRADAKNHTVNLEIGFLEDENVICDRRIVEQILMNITYNAIKNTRDDGRIDVSIAQAGPADERGAVYEFSVKDSSLEISQERVRQIRDAFEQDDSYTYVGVDDFGLTIAKKLVDVMGGVLEFDFNPKEGMEIVVTFEFPVCDEKLAKERGAADVDYFGKRVLIVDDMMINRQIVSAILELYGITADEAKDGKEAVERLVQSPPAFYDVVLMDVQMPNLDGYEACRLIREIPEKETSTVPVIAMTASIFEADKRKAFEAGMDGFITKPVDRKELMDHLSELFGRKK